MFSQQASRTNPRNEGKTFYPFGCPKPEVEKGEFIRIENVCGGADTIAANNEVAILRIAEWHENVATRNGVIMR